MFKMFQNKIHRRDPDFQIRLADRYDFRMGNCRIKTADMDLAADLVCSKYFKQFPGKFIIVAPETVRQIFLPEFRSGKIIRQNPLLRQIQTAFLNIRIMISVLWRAA